MNLQDKKLDHQIREALKSAAKMKRLSVVSAVTGIGETRLREIMKSTSDLSVMDRAMLGIHLAP
jgi:hypothetical protein